MTQYYPKVGIGGQATFPIQFPHVRFMYPSFATTPVELLSRDGKREVVNHATGFFWEGSGKLFFVTALHVLSGRDSFTDRSLSDQGYIPAEIRIFPFVQKSDLSVNRRVPLEIKLEENGAPVWRIDPDFSRLRTDIAVIDVTSMVENKDDVTAFNREPADELFAFTGMDVCVIGYPTRYYSEPMQPIWRRGSFAAEPGLIVDGKPMFLIDASTSSGMSGSPVIQLHIGPAPVSNGSGGAVIKASSIFTIRLIGVYAGRFSHRHPAGEVGYAFYENRIPIITA